MNADNQQEIGLVAWLAGIIDGEGSIVLTISQRRDNSRRRSIPLRIAPKVIIGNTDPLIIERCVKALDVIGVGRYIRHERKPVHMICGNHVKSFKPITTIEVVGFRRVRKLLDAMLPWLAGEKATRASLLLAFVVGRLDYSADGKAAANRAYRQKDVDHALAFLRVTATKQYDRLAKILNEHTRETRSVVQRIRKRDRGREWIRKKRAASRCALNSRETARDAGNERPLA